MPVQVGAQVDDFAVSVCDGETFRSVHIGELVGERGLVIVATGLAFSAIARNWWKRFERYGWDEFDRVPVVGFSRDGPYAQNAFLRELGRPAFRFVADVDGELTDALGLRTEREGMAGLSTPWRAVVVVDDGLEVQYVHVADDWIMPLPHEDIEDAVGEL